MYFIFLRKLDKINVKKYPSNVEFNIITIIFFTFSRGLVEINVS
jgi:hypothetical protein